MRIFSFYFDIISNLLFLSFITLTFLRLQATYFLECSSICLMFPHDYIQGLYLWQKNHKRRSCVPLIASYIVLTQNLICPISSEVNLNHMIELVSARFSHCKVPFSPFLLNQYCFLFQLVVFGFFFFWGGAGGSGGGMYLKPL